MTRFLPTVLLLAAFFAQACQRDSLPSEEGQAWTLLATETSPSARHDAVMVSQGAQGHLLLFGGRAQTGCLNDLWSFSPAKKSWSRLESDGAPSPRSGAGMAWDESSKRLVVYGGYCDDGMGRARFLNDLWFYDQKNGWTREYLKGGPGRRAWSALAIQGERLILFGGSGPDPIHHRNDLWALDLKELKWRRLATDGGPLVSGRPVVFTSKTKPESLWVFGRNGIPVPQRTELWSLNIPNDSWSMIQNDKDGIQAASDYHLALGSELGGLVVLKGPQEPGQTWKMWSSPSGSRLNWQGVRLDSGPEATTGISCQVEPGQSGSWICFGGAFRQDLSDQTWRLKVHSAKGQGQ